MAKTKKRRKQGKRRNKTIKNKNKKNKYKDHTISIADTDFGQKEYIVSNIGMNAIFKVDGNNKASDFNKDTLLYKYMLNEFKRRLLLLLKENKKSRNILKKKFKIKYSIKNIVSKLDKLSSEKVEEIYFALL